jgi:hypothetical protein
MGTAEDVAVFGKIRTKRRFLKADLKIQGYRMFENHSVQDFTNYFELILQDVSRPTKSEQCTQTPNFIIMLTRSSDWDMAKYFVTVSWWPIAGR